MSKLKEYLQECKQSYYAGKPIISDSQYDVLEDSFNAETSIGTNKGRTKHWYKMYSLQKKYTDEELPNLDGYVETPKLDGAAVALRFIRGRLDSVVTRGNGEYGENISHLFDNDICDKLYIPYGHFSFTGQITGEIVAPKYIENARNYAAGALNLKHRDEFWTKEVTFIAYDLQEIKLDYMETLCLLSDWGFYTVEDIGLDQYPQDGLVYRLDDIYEYKNLGYTSKHPRGAFALKERSEGIKTKILDVEWETGKSGKVTPVAILEPIIIDDAKVSRATLNNPGFIEALGVNIGDYVMVERAGGIIPRIIKKVT